MLRKIFVVFGFILVVLLWAVVGMIFGYFGGKSSWEKELTEQKKEKEAMKQELPVVRVEQVKLKDVALSVKGDGRVTAQKMIKVTGEVQGRIVAGRLKKGTNFSKGELLYALDDKEYALGLKARKSNFITMLANVLPDIKSDYSAEFDKWMKFYVGINPEQTLASFPAINTNKEKTFIASKGILAEFYTIRSMEEKLSKYNYYAPFSGSVMASYADKGTIINPGSPVVDIIQRGQLEVEVALSLVASKKVNVGTMVSLSDKNAGKTYKGRVTRKGAFINAATQSIPVYITVIGGTELYNGMYLAVSFPSGMVKNTFEIPVKAIHQDKVYVVSDSLAIQKPVKIYSVQNENAYVLGLTDKEQVITESVAIEGDSVKVKPVLKALN